MVGLHWLDRGANPVGSDPGTAVLLPSDRAPARVGVIELVEDVARFLPQPGAAVAVNGRALTDAVTLSDDHDGSPTVLEVGSLRVHLIRRFGDRLGVRVRDLESAARRAFRGIDHYPVREQWRFDARFEPYDPPRISRVPTVLDLEEAYSTPGTLAFEHEGKIYRLDAFLEPGETDLFIVFADATTGTETYGGGRYLYTKPPDERGHVVLDFNRAYNPPCVFTAHATCALPLAHNRLPFRVEAGERRYDP